MRQLFPSRKRSNLHEVDPILKTQQQKDISKAEKQINIPQPIFTPHILGRFVPKKIFQDKQQLYCQGMELKTALNNISNQNVRLKTRLSLLQKQFLRQNKVSQSNNFKKLKLSRLNSKNVNKNDAFCDFIQEKTKNYKKIVHDLRDQIYTIQNQKNKLKKMLKYTQINQLKLQKDILLDENKRISEIVYQLSSQLQYQKNKNENNQNLIQSLQEQIQKNKWLNLQNEKLNSELSKFQKQLERRKNKQKKLIFDLESQKRKNMQLHNDQKKLLENINMLRGQSQKKNKNIRNLITVRQGRRLYTDHRGDNNSAILKTSNGQQLQKTLIFKQRQELQQQINRLKQQNYELKKQKQKINIQKSQQTSPKLQYKKQNIQIKQSDEEQIYATQFQTQNLQNKIQNQKQQQQLQLQDFQLKQVNKIKKSKKNKSKMHQIKSLLIYRMKALRYPFQDLKSDLLAAKTNTFTNSQLIQMFVAQPFYLQPNQAKTILKYCCDNKKMQSNQKLSTQSLLIKLEQIIGHFDLLDDDQYQNIIIKITQITSTYPQQLQKAFQNIKNGNNTISKQDLIQMWKRLQLQQKQIDVIISQLSLMSIDLQHLNFLAFFERFYLQQSQQEIIEQDQEQYQQSPKPSPRIKNSKNKNKK